MTLNRHNINYVQNQQIKSDSWHKKQKIQKLTHTQQKTTQNVTPKKQNKQQKTHLLAILKKKCLLSTDILL